MLVELMREPVALGIILFVFGLITGSFLNVCIHRIPRGTSLVSPASQCACGQKIPWRLNIPVLSWLLLGGKAACCGRSIPSRYLAVELLTGALFVFAGFHFQSQEPYFLFLSVNLVFISILLCSTFIDLEHMIIPDRLSVGGAFVGLILAFAFPALSGWWDDALLARMASLTSAILGLLVGSGTLYWVGIMAETVLRREAIGQGDVKLLGCVGAFCGWKGALFSIFGGALVGTSLLLPIVLLRSRSQTASAENNNSDRGETIGWGVEVPFGPFLALAALLYQLGLDRYVDQYFEQLGNLLRLAWNNAGFTGSFW
ncbi:MAG: prepilin peptidase [Opitutae bacterium]|nr:prepilin peptidase [Opitutae bacterium]|tara:strand:+ start:6805 stop:7746 length:942 start_codon:yes stop_codon:yes gene_type:complete